MHPVKPLSALLLLTLPAIGLASDAPAARMDLTNQFVGYFCLVVLAAAYITAMMEDRLDLRKSKPMMLGAGLIWIAIATAYQQQGHPDLAAAAFRENLLAYSELFLFIMVSVTYLNAMEDSGVFVSLRLWLLQKRLSYRQLFWISGILVFLISTILNGLTAALLMGAVVTAVGRDNRHFASVACVNIVCAVNAGGSFSPVGGISTLLVWQRGIVDFFDFFLLFLPCLVNFLVPAIFMHFAVPKEKPAVSEQSVFLRRGGLAVVGLFLLTIFSAVIFDTFLGLPPAGGMMIGLVYLQFFAYYLQRTSRPPPGPERRRPGAEMYDQLGKVRFDVFQKIARLEWDTLLFFYGAMMCVGGLNFLGYMGAASQFLYGQLEQTVANILIGLVSAFIDNGTLMFAILSMHPDLSQGQWLLVTLTLGVGGSLTAIGSAPGVGLLGQAKGLYTFASHLKWTPVILLGYFASIGVHFLVNAHLFRMH